MLEDFQGMKMEAEKEEGEDDAEGDYSQDIWRSLFWREL
jgi:hypothetical protein